jgi:ATP-dependent Lon protease
VLPIGGVKQKLLVARRAGITTVLLPRRNEPDLDDVPESVRAELTVHLVGDVHESSISLLNGRPLPQPGSETFSDLHRDGALRH